MRLTEGGTIVWDSKLVLLVQKLASSLGQTTIDIAFAFISGSLGALLVGIAIVQLVFLIQTCACSQVYRGALPFVIDAYCTLKTISEVLNQKQQNKNHSDQQETSSSGTSSDTNNNTSSSNSSSTSNNCSTSITRHTSRWKQLLCSCLHVLRFMWHGGTIGVGTYLFLLPFLSKLRELNQQVVYYVHH